MFTRIQWVTTARQHILTPSCILKTVTRMTVGHSIVEKWFKTKEETLDYIPMLENIVKLVITYSNTGTIMTARSFTGIARTMPLLRSIACQGIKLTDTHMQALAKCPLLSRINIATIFSSSGSYIAQNYLAQERQTPLTKLILSTYGSHIPPEHYHHLSHLQVFGTPVNLLQNILPTNSLTSLTHLIIYDQPSELLKTYFNTSECKITHLSVLTFYSKNTWVSSLATSHSIHTLEIISSKPFKKAASKIFDLLSSCLSITTLVLYVKMRQSRVFQIPAIESSL
eukprot:gene19566-23441_t